MKFQPMSTGAFHKHNAKDLILAAIVFVISALVYIRTLAPSLLFGDSGEFQTLAYTLGWAHPPGYPVYLLVAKLFISTVMVGNVAFRVNLISALSSAIALSTLYLIVDKLTARRLVSLGSVLILALHPIFWSQSVIAEVLTPAAALVVVEILLLLNWEQTRQPHFLFITGFLGGLSLGVHYTVAFISPGVALFLALNTRRKSDWVSACIGAFAGVLTTILAYFFIDNQNTSTSFLCIAFKLPDACTVAPENLDSFFERLVFMLSAQTFNSYMFSTSVGVVLYRILLSFLQFNWLTNILFLLGVVGLFVYQPRRAILILLSWATILFFLANYHVPDILVFYVPTWALFMIPVAFALAMVQEFLCAYFQRIHAGRWAVPVANFAVLCLLLLQPDLVGSWKMLAKGELRSGILADDLYPVQTPYQPINLARRVVNVVDDDAIIFTGWQMVYPLYYAARVENDFIGINIFANRGITKPARDYVRKNLEQRSVYVVGLFPETPIYYVIEAVDSETNLYQIKALREPYFYRGR